MRSLILKLFLSALFISSAILVAEGQTCTGSLGDPVINETFGAGTVAGIGPPLSPAVTNYTYINKQCPEDGQYTIATSTTGCYAPTWHNVYTDHTGDANGYMMIINASYQPGIFYTQVAQGSKLCPNTTYEFAAWIANMISLSSGTESDIKPNITFTITTTSGKLLAPPYQTGDIPAVAGNDATNLWHHYGTYFTTPTDGSDIVVTMTNNAPGGDGNDLLLDDITFRPCGPIIESSFGGTAGDDNKTLCEGDNATYTLNASQTGYNDPKFQWQVNINGNGWANINGETSPTLLLDKTFINAVAGIYQYRIGILEGASTSPACSIYSKPLTVQVYPLPVIALPATTLACQGEPLILGTSIGDSYEWTGPNGFSSAEQNPVVANSTALTDAGVYTVKVTTNNCPSFGSTTVNVSPAIVPAVNGEPSPICVGQSTQLNASGGFYYKWEPSTGLDHDDVASPIATPLTTTTYRAIISNDGCTDSSKTITVNVRANPVANAGSRQTIFEGQQAKLTGTIKGDNIVGYYWTPSDYLDNPLSLTPVATPPSDITYTFHVVSESCGESEDNVFVRVYEKLGLPNTFTPNGDEINDKWDIDKINTYPGCTVMVYNRAGQQVFKSTGYGKPWDGTYNGSPLPEGTYYYIIDLNIGTPKIGGWVLIVR